MIVLQPTRPHWNSDGDDCPEDPCAHSPVDFRVGDVVLVRSEDGDWTVSASAVYLLRTLEKDHTPEQPVCEHLFPCCGHSMYEMEGQKDVLITGCPNGMDFPVQHVGDEVLIDAPGRPSLVVSAEQWRRAVHRFSDAVREFYERSAPKRFINDYEEQGFRAFQREWFRRRWHS